MANPVSTLSGILPPAQSGGMTNAEITLQEISGFSLVQFSAWPETLRATAKVATRFTEVGQAPDPGSSVNGKTATLLRVEPLKWWHLEIDMIARYLRRLVEVDGWSLTGEQNER